MSDPRTVTTTIVIDVEQQRHLDDEGLRDAIYLDFKDAAYAALKRVREELER